MKNPHVQRRIRVPRKQIHKVHTAIPEKKFERLKTTMHYAFLANGAAISAILIKIDIHRHSQSAYCFTLGVLFILVMTILMYSYPNSNQDLHINTYKKIVVCIVNKMLVVFLWASILAFLVGVIITMNNI